MDDASPSEAAVGGEPPQKGGLLDRFFRSSPAPHLDLIRPALWTVTPTNGPRTTPRTGPLYAAALVPAVEHRKIRCTGCYGAAAPGITVLECRVDCLRAGS